MRIDVMVRTPAPGSRFPNLNVCSMAFIDTEFNLSPTHMEKRFTKIVKCLALFFSVAPTNLFAAVQINVAAIDRDRILKAADAALALEPVTITASRAKLS